MSFLNELAKIDRHLIRHMNDNNCRGLDGNLLFMINYNFFLHMNWYLELNGNAMPYLNGLIK